NTGQSILRFGIREVICVPMKGRHETLGVLYLDTRSTARDIVASNNPDGKFTEDHLKLAAAIAHQAALAVEETRYYQAMVQAERPLPDLPSAQVDREAIHRALLNIVTNALDAVAECERPQVVVGTTLEADGAWVRVHVRDNGTGIAAEKVGEIFKPFFSTKGG